MLRRAHNSMPLAAGPAGAAPQWVQLLPAGTFTGRDGAGPYSLDDPQAVIAATLAAAAGADLPIDYDHQILWSQKNGQPAIAGGWCKEFQAREDGVWARVEWTPVAAARIAAREYRYLSPVFWHDASGRIIRIEHAALTNVPNLELEAIASRSPNGGEMDPKLFAALLATLGLPADAKAEQIVAHAKALVEDGRATREVLAVMAKDMRLPENASPKDVSAAWSDFSRNVDELFGAVAELTGLSPSDRRLSAHAKELLGKRGQAATADPDPTKWAPVSELQAVASRLKALEDGQAQEKATEAVEAAMKAGKVTPKNKKWALGYASKDLEGFNAFVEGAPVIVKPGQEGPGGQPPAADGQLGDVDLAVCSRMGLDPEEFKKHRQQEA